MRGCQLPPVRLGGRARLCVQLFNCSTVRACRGCESAPHCNESPILSRAGVRMHPQSTAAATAAEPPHNKRRLGRSRTTNDVSFLPKQPPGPFAQARRRRDLVEVFLSALGGEQACSELTLV